MKFRAVGFVLSILLSLQLQSMSCFSAFNIDRNIHHMGKEFFVSLSASKINSSELRSILRKYMLNGENQLAVQKLSFYAHGKFPGEERAYNKISEKVEALALGANRIEHLIELAIRGDRAVYAEIYNMAFKQTVLLAHIHSIYFNEKSRLDLNSLKMLSQGVYKSLILLKDLKVYTQDPQSIRDLKMTIYFLTKASSQLKIEIENYDSNI